MKVFDAVMNLLNFILYNTLWLRKWKEIFTEIHLASFCTYTYNSITQNLCFISILKKKTILYLVSLE